MHRVFFSLILVLLLAVPAFADGAVVTGTGDPAMDVANVQAALDKGGTVQLRGRFDFGEDGRVKITKNVRILGRMDGSGEPQTTITGGDWTFYSPLPVDTAPPGKDGPIIVVRSLRFDGATGTPLHFPYVGGLEIGDCVVTNVIPKNTAITWSQGDSLPFQAGIVIGNRLVHPKGGLKGAVTGTVLIENNRLEMINDHPEETAGYGVLADWTTGAEMTIRNNEIHRTSRNGIEVLDNELDAKAKGFIRIESNRIATDDEGIAYPNKFGPNGIVCGWYFDTKGGADFSRNSRAVITGNSIEARGEESIGLLLYANDIVATCNDIIMGGGRSARGVVQTGSRGFFANNRVRGRANYALFCYPFEALTATANTFAWTELGLFTGFKGQVLLGGRVNVVVGTVPSLIDHGQGNRVVDCQPCALPEADPDY
ncbi:right-handed parallel beta-helix repeat-containing protein [uncultured Pseudodesulfovibrio sp.]|uniref:right-handed parallel beta-helix repeat-containing protein n=1 Tax=uncultured Pseudodesulfovibrio sp. TaxID=2035858 RepID=UPI0029C61FDF|nr:right-handed parallel beta-helix repeat-containing protein [uncultured Pseudodesulfovibrio sp.]